MALLFFAGVTASNREADAELDILSDILGACLGGSK